jgi:4-amino-4-deoxy-L-arabinose transferase-like glycosyltransferase
MGRHPVVATLLLGLATTLPFLGARDLWYPDEPDVAQAALEMWRIGDWIVPRHNGEPWADYPPLAYWLGMLASDLLGGLSEFSLRLPSALLAAALAGATAAFAARQLSRETGLLAGLVLLSTPFFAYQAVSIHPDMAFAALQGMGLLAYVTADAPTAGRRPALLRALAFALFGGAVLAKGPLGLLLPGLVLSLWHASFGEWRRVLRLAPLAGVSLAVALPWYAAFADATGAEFVGRELWEQNFGRMAAAAGRGHGRPWHYYGLRVWPDLAPWSVCLLPALGTGFRALWRDRVRRFAWIWLVAPLAFFSLATSKREVYLLPVYPAAALLVADFVARAPRSAWVRGLLAAAATALLAAGAAGIAAGAGWDAVAARFADDAQVRAVLDGLAGAVPALGAGLLVAGALVAVTWRRRGEIPAVIALALCVLAGFAAALGAVAPPVDRAKSVRPHAEWLVAHLPDGAPIALLHRNPHLKECGFLYYGRRPLVALPDADAVDAELSANPEALVVVERRLADAMFESRPGHYEARQVHAFRAGSTRYVVFGGDAQRARLRAPGDPPADR